MECTHCSGRRETCVFAVTRRPLVDHAVSSEEKGVQPKYFKYKR